MSRFFHIGRYVAYFERGLSLFNVSMTIWGSSNMEDLKGKFKLQFSNMRTSLIKNLDRGNVAAESTKSICRPNQVEVR